MNYANWLFKVEGRVATLSLNRVESLNNIDLETLGELKAICTEIKNQPEIWVVILKGEGKHFCTGMSTEIIAHMHNQPEDVYREYLKNAQRCIDLFESIPQPVICRIHGFCFGAGIILACASDFRISSNRAIFCLPEVKRSIGVIMGTHRVSRICGIANTKQMAMLGDRFNASQARSYQLVTTLVEPSQLDTAIERLARKLLALPPLAVELNKKIIDYNYHTELRERQDFEIDSQYALLATNDFNEASQSFREKRQGHYSKT